MKTKYFKKSADPNQLVNITVNGRMKFRVKMMQWSDKHKLFNQKLLWKNWLHVTKQGSLCSPLPFSRC